MEKLEKLDGRRAWLVFMFSPCVSGDGSYSSSAAALNGSPIAAASAPWSSSIGPMVKDAARECVREAAPRECVRVGPTAVVDEAEEATPAPAPAPAPAAAPEAVIRPRPEPEPELMLPLTPLPAPAALPPPVMSQPRYWGTAAPPASWVVLRVLEKESEGEWDRDEVLSRWSAKVFRDFFFQK